MLAHDVLKSSVQCQVCVCVTQRECSPPDKQLEKRLSALSGSTIKPTPLHLHPNSFTGHKMSVCVCMCVQSCLPQTPMQGSGFYLFPANVKDHFSSASVTASASSSPIMQSSCLFSVNLLLLYLWTTWIRLPTLSPFYRIQ